ncbi:MAG: pyruvate phosphate dikinase, partial [Anaerolineae bacterium]
MTKRLLGTALLLLATVAVTAGEAAADQDSYAAWITQMKEAERGPFARIRWFCNDGAVLPPKAYACSDRGGGHQHGEWSDRTRELRDHGYYIANILAGLDGQEWLSDDQFRDRYGQLAVERFLIGADDGWILRRALFYRGAIQEEDERE